MKIAFVYDRVNKFGGAERVLLSLHEIWPNAPLYTAVYNKERAKWADVFRIRPSFLNGLSFLQNRQEILSLITPYAFESFDFADFDVVLSITSADAKSIITKPSTLHICYCLTPTRYIWSGYQDYFAQPGMGSLDPVGRLFIRIFTPHLRSWDFVSSFRADNYIAISETVKKRIKKYYKQNAKVLYPPVDADIFYPAKVQSRQPKKYFLIVARLVPYKKVDYVISAFNKLGWNLKIIGDGVDEIRLKKIAQKNIEFINGNLTDEKLCWYYQNCRALIFPGEEDFGLTAVEAQACGKPVIGYKSGGMEEIIISGQTGELYDEANEEALIALLTTINIDKYNRAVCRRNSERFTKNIFREKMKETIVSCWERWKKR